MIGLLAVDGGQTAMRLRHSNVWLGSRVIAASLRSIDGRGGSTSLTARVQVWRAGGDG